MVFWLATAGCFAQNNIQSIHGKVVDGLTKEPLSYASVFIKGKPIGTITNAVGEFVFHIPEEYTQDTLIISFIGYHSFLCLVKDAILPQYGLIPEAIILQEVDVSDVTADRIITSALDRIEKNYPVTPFLLKAFYRDWKVQSFLTQDSVKVSLIEAAVTIYDKGYKRVNNKSLNEEVYLNELRRARGSGSTYNYIDLVLKQNYIRHNRSRNIGNVVSPLGLKGGINYDIENILAGEDGNVYLISGTLISGLGKYDLYINQNDFAVIRIDFHGEVRGDSVLGLELMPAAGKTSQMIFIDNTLTFRKYQGRYYPNYTRLNWKTRTLFGEKKEVVERREFFIELLTTEIVADDVNARKSALKYPMLPNSSLEKQIRPYNETFWNQFNIVRQNPLDRKLKLLLEKDGDLEDQFRTQVADSIPRKRGKMSTKKERTGTRTKGN